MTSFEEGAERNKALGIWGALGGSGAAVGVLAGGVLTKYLGWEWIFFVNVPVGALVLALTPRIVPESRREGAERSYDVARRGARSAAASRCSSTPSRGRPTSAGRRRGRSSCSSPRARCSSRSSSTSGASQRPADAVPHLPRANRRRRERRRLAARRGALRQLLPADPVRAERARLLGAEDRRDLRRDGGNGRRGRRSRAGVDDEARAEAGDRGRARAADRRDDLVLADPRARQLRVRSAARLPDGRRRHRLRVRARSRSPRSQVWPSARPDSPPG